MTPMTITHDWFYWALLSAVFAGLTAIFAKIGLEGVDSDLATLLACGVDSKDINIRFLELIWPVWRIL
jgi:uncharacterized membrane protein